MSHSAKSYRIVIMTCALKVTISKDSSIITAGIWFVFDSFVCDSV